MTHEVLGVSALTTRSRGRKLKGSLKLLEKEVCNDLKAQVAQWARLWAARHNKSVSRVVGELLEKLMLEEEGYLGAKEHYLSTRPSALKKSGSYPRREELHARLNPFLHTPKEIEP